jgi:hypothetical protein
MLSVVPSARPCEEKARILLDYQTATELYSSAVAELVSKMGVVPRTEYDKLLEAAEKARQLSADARDSLDRHVANHHC